MPAIIDTHTHLSQTKDALAHDLRRRDYSGVSAAMSLGQDQAEAMSMRGQPQPGLARFFSAGLGITGNEKARQTTAIQVNTPAEARAAVQKVAATKPDIIKIWIDDRMGTVTKLTPDLYAAVIDEAHRNKLRVTAHIFALEDAKGAIKAGLDAFAHVPARDKEVDDEFMSILKARGPANLVLVPNLPNRGVRMDLSWLKGSLSAAELQKLEMGNTDNPEAQQAFGIQARNLAKMSAAGVRVALGTDGNTAWQPHVEMADMVAAGLTPMQVIVASTRNGAEFLRMTDAGTIAANKSADFIVLDANPLDDITNTRRIADVYIDGRKVDRQAMLARLGARIGDRVSIGAAGFTVARVLDYRPDQGSAFVDLAPSLLIPLADLPATELLGPGSRATYNLLFAGAPADIRDLRAELRERKAPSERLVGVDEESPQIQSSTWEWDTMSPSDRWMHSHNVVHHTWTNVLHKDLDVGYGILRVYMKDAFGEATATELVRPDFVRLAAEE